MRPETRPRRDKAWALAYWLLLLVTLGWAVVSLALRPDLLSLLSSPAYLDDPAHCPPGLQLGMQPHTVDAGPTAASAGAVSGLTAEGVAAAVARADAASLQPRRRRSAMASGFLLSASLTASSAAAREALWPAAARAPYLQTPSHPLPTPRLNASGAAGAGSYSGNSAGDGGGSGDDGGDGDYSYGSSVSVYDPDADQFPRLLLDYGGLLLLASLGAAGVVAAMFLAALRHSPWSLVLLAAGMQVGAPLMSAVLASRAGHSSLALLLALTAAALAVSLYCGTSSLRLAARLLGLAEAALRRNKPLLGLCAALQVCLGGSTLMILAAAAVVGSAGELVPNPLRAGSPACATPAGAAVACCALAPSAALPAYLPAAALCLAWTLLLLFELKVFVVSGVVAQWYFSPEGHLAGGAAAGGAVVMGGGGGGGYSSGRSLLASLGHALGPSFGSLCCGSAVLGLTAYPRAISRFVSRVRHGGPLAALTDPRVGPGSPAAALGCCTSGAPCACPCPAAVAACPCCLAVPCCAPCLACCCCLGLWGCLGTVMETLTKFATVVMAMGGQGFWPASVEAVSLLRRNLMDAYAMWWYLPMILHCGAAAFAAAWGYAAYWLAAGCWAPLTGAPPLSAAAASALGGLAAGAAALVLSFLVSVLTSVADALFICFVLDRDSSAVTWHELHATLAELPCCAAARAAAEGRYGGAAAAAAAYGGEYGGAAAPPPYYYVPPPAVPLMYGAEGAPFTAYGSVAPSYHVVQPLPPLPPPPPVPAAATLGHPVGYGTQRPRYGGYGGGFWGWLRSPGSSGSGMYGVPVAGGGRHRNDRPQHPPPAVLSPPYSDQRFPLQLPGTSLPPLPPPQAPPPFYRGSVPQS
ncbi:hypothetical protein GPECTOR_61g783 [Gonium pectorale]|uniref:Uncharacterized protein n=1 Tax=Gonium pectorale TaxID=33097 RepID=A0A150G675_GONPE|nr:hypothetical protein GPECTOR_61g783 [Gonium pectorale]|eukprot:KXZ44830.1 hypothetical protein GPECTOR_61g783 [Gonium pectorale]